MQVAGVPAYLVVPHEQALVLGATNVETTMFFLPASFVTRDWENLPVSKPMSLLYTGEPSSVVYDIVTRVPHYASLDHYFLGLDGGFAIVPIRERGMVCVSSVKSAAPQRRNKHSGKKCSHIYLKAVLLLTFLISYYCCPCGPYSTRQIE